MNDHPTLPYSPSSTTADIPDFVLIRPIGEGGFGQVWLATNQATGQLRAVKLIPLDVSDRVDPAGRELMSLIRLERVAQQRHPHLTTIHHVGRTPQHLFYVMDLADDLSGGPLRLTPPISRLPSAGGWNMGPWPLRIVSCTVSSCYPRWPVCIRPGWCIAT